ncbi:DUF1844 domain-containing protein [Planctomicrobium sp. SH664]|uniref:DUF1844 domain-containing protein n=1 Tax=Planctomicrobium sp. SH664 TaxID=3448125 RepID=UPI003F5C72E4
MSGDSSQEKPQIELVSDDDWKNRVKAEDAKLDAELEKKNEDQHTGEGAGTAKLPPATFPMLVQMFSTQAIMSLGLIPDPKGESQVQLPMAKHFIDLLSMLEEKTKGNLSEQESKFLEQTLHELRMAYIEISRQRGTP